jgi:putative DNA primase/helicase
VDDPRPDELLERCGRLYWQLNAAIAWTDGLRNDIEAKTCSRSGSASWKAAKPFREQVGEEQTAAGYFKERARKRNPAVTASASGFDLVEYDGDRNRLDRELGIPRLPPTLGWRSRRGPHLVYRTPSGAAPIKVQIDPEGVTLIGDGYLVCAPAWRAEYGVVYELNGIQDPVQLPAELRLVLQEYGRETRAETRRRFAEGEPIPKGHRDVTIFWEAVDRLRDGLPQKDALEQVLELNREQCTPPLDDALVRKQFRGAVKFAVEHPTETELARVEARRVLRESKVSPARGEGAKGGLGGVDRLRARKTRAELFLPFVDVQLTGPPRWLWRGKIPEGAVTLLAGRPKLGKSLLTVWVSAQLSRGLLEGDHREAPAGTLLIAAEDPPDIIVKPRLIAAAADENLVGTLVTKSDQDRQDRQGRPREDVGGLGGLDQHGAYTRRVSIPDEYWLLEQIIVETEPKISLLVLDPINSFISHKVDAHRDAEIRRVLDPLAALAARHRFAALAVVHLNRRSDTDVLNRITGSAGYGGSARSILTFGRHPENAAQRVVAAEGNWQKEAQSDLFALREVVVFPDADPDDQTMPTLVHVGATDLDSSDLIDQLDDDRSAFEEAKDYLNGELAGGPVPVADLRRGAEANGLSWRTVERAKKLLGVEARRISSAGSPRGAGRWEWFLELTNQQEGEATP